jgi:CBS domain-containing protein
VDSVIVVEGDEAIGILTDRDLLKMVAKNLAGIQSTKVRDAMSKPLLKVPPDISVDEALAVMRSKNVKKLPVTSEGRLVGIVTSDDILRAISTTA